MKIFSEIRTHIIQLLNYFFDSFNPRINLLAKLTIKNNPIKKIKKSTDQRTFFINTKAYKTPGQGHQPKKSKILFTRPLNHPKKYFRYRKQ
jgi:hypothetical protein